MDSLGSLMEDAGLGRHAKALAALARPCVHLASVAGNGESGVGASRLGGAPDLPADTGWPVWRDRPLAFLAQVDLAGVAGLPGTDVLPEHGLLSFFYEVEEGAWGFDPADRGSFRVLYTPAGVPLRRREIPAGVPDYGRFDPAALFPSAGVTLPSWEEPAVEALEMDEADQEAYGELEIPGHPGEAAGSHQLLGWPTVIQSGYMEMECQLASNGVHMGGAAVDEERALPLVSGAGDWRLLLQLDSDDHAGMSWGDSGRLYFWIRAPDLAARDFDHVWMVLQCY